MLLSRLGVSRFSVFYSKNEKALTDCKMTTSKNKAIVKIRRPGDTAWGIPFGRGANLARGRVKVPYAAHICGPYHLPVGCS